MSKNIYASLIEGTCTAERVLRHIGVEESPLMLWATGQYISRSRDAIIRSQKSRDEWWNNLSEEERSQYPKDLQYKWMANDMAALETNALSVPNFLQDFIDKNDAGHEQVLAVVLFGHQIAEVENKDVPAEEAFRENVQLAKKDSGFYEQESDFKLANIHEFNDVRLRFLLLFRTLQNVSMSEIFIDMINHFDPDNEQGAPRIRKRSCRNAPPCHRGYKTGADDPGKNF